MAKVVPTVNEHKLDKAGNPAGGRSVGTGYRISWQNGPLGRDGDRLEPNGAFVETVLEAVIKRMEFYQNTKFACPANGRTLYFLNLALDQQNARTRDRESRQVEGTHAE